jgi:hypothetical protein
MIILANFQKKIAKHYDTYISRTRSKTGKVMSFFPSNPNEGSQNIHMPDIYG